MMVTKRDRTSPTVLTNLLEKGSAFTCSYEEEKRALEMALDWIQSRLTSRLQKQRLFILTDIQSICTALLSHTPLLDNMLVLSAHCNPVDSKPLKNSWK